MIPSTQTLRSPHRDAVTRHIDDMAGDDIRTIELRVLEQHIARRELDGSVRLAAVVDESVAVTSYAVCHFVFHQPTIVQEMFDCDISYKRDVVGDEPAMASPPHRFAAHDHLRITTHEEFVHTGDELWCLHVVGV